MIFNLLMFSIDQCKYYSDMIRWYRFIACVYNTMNGTPANPENKRLHSIDDVGPFGNISLRKTLDWALSYTLNRTLGFLSLTLNILSKSLNGALNFFPIVALSVSFVTLYMEADLRRKQSEAQEPLDILQDIDNKQTSICKLIQEYPAFSKISHPLFQENIDLANRTRDYIKEPEPKASYWKGLSMVFAAHSVHFAFAFLRMDKDESFIVQFKNNAFLVLPAFLAFIINSTEKLHKSNVTKTDINNKYGLKDHNLQQIKSIHAQQVLVEAAMQSLIESDQVNADDLNAAFVEQCSQTLAEMKSKPSTATANNIFYHVRGVLLDGLPIKQEPNIPEAILHNVTIARNNSFNALSSATNNNDLDSTILDEVDPDSRASPESCLANCGAARQGIRLRTIQPTQE